MGESNEGFGTGILKGLKRVLFTGTEQEAALANPESGMRNPESTKAPMRNAESPNPESHNAPMRNAESANAESGDMKLKVYQLLESLNKPGVDFFEVWNAAVEMGGANSANIKAAFTSLRFADKSLTKQRLLDTGSGYVSGLQSVIETEAQKKAEEKSRLIQEKEQVRSSLTTEIQQIEQQLSALQQRLQAKMKERDSVDSNYDPRIQDIDSKVRSGKSSVDAVLAEMQQVINIIQTDLN